MAFFLIVIGFTSSRSLFTFFGCIYTFLAAFEFLRLVWVVSILYVGGYLFESTCDRNTPFAEFNILYVRTYSYRRFLLRCVFLNQSAL